ncbi:sigma-70 family RNA polymerase sigma factor [Methylomicrobium album]|uniref:RNA polymerase sigma factor, sigma-70 family n=1 Tax=Methylomicrobium album BG8 TaxID=686340 RepID=H8GJC6_METAL|nr:RNA polymerase sigma factor RpoD/SigA [Methylomicrobium album]EIC29116.1 RNA polymerase sigma factor, sigma-70 family [Methylomicrobium album BG8]
MAVTISEGYFSELREETDQETVYPEFDGTAEKPESSTVNTVNTGESNMLIARELKIRKADLIDALLCSVLTPLWLLNEYERQFDKEPQEVDDEPKLSSELKSSLVLIHQSYQRFIHAGAGPEAQDLRQALQWFPFVFKDLTQLVDLHCYAALQATESSVGRRKLGARLRRRNARRCREDFDAILELDRQHFGAWEWLFPENKDRYEYVQGLLAKERLWLASRQQLVTANSGLVLYIANQYKGGFLDFDDLVQEGQTGLLKAADRYDYRLGFKFSTYAGYWIRQAISRALSRCERVVRIPCGQIGVINKFFRDREQLILRLGKEPSLQDLAGHTGLSLEEINKILAISQAAVPIEASAENDEDTYAPIDFLEQQVFSTPFGVLAQSDLEQLIEQAFRILSPREAKIISQHFGIDTEREKTLKEIGAELNLTRERVRQIEMAALNKIRSHYGGQLGNFL